MPIKELEFYILLRLGFPAVADGQSFSVGLLELSEVLFVSDRHAKRILKRLESEGFIYWKPGVGRGNRSRLLFRFPFHKAVKSCFNHLLSQGKIKEASQLLKRDGIPEMTRRQCYRQLVSELSLPRIEESEIAPLRVGFQGSFLMPAVVSTSTGRWLFVQNREPRCGSES